MSSRGSRAEDGVIFAAGLVQGIVLVTFPAASSVLTSNRYFGLSSTEYGLIFAPQVVAAVLVSLAGPRVTARFGSRTVFRLGLAADVLGMAVFAASNAIAGQHVSALVALLVATGLVGTGFGLTVPVLNTLAADHHPEHVDLSILILNALLGTGTALAPVFTAVFAGAGIWWGLPLAVAAAAIMLLAVSVRLPLALHGPPSGPSGNTKLGRRYLPFAGFAVLYGICETMSGNWSQPFVEAQAHASASAASLALTAFWGSVTVGRLIFAGAQRLVPSVWLFRVLAGVLAVGYALLFAAHGGSVGVDVVWFVVTGIGCSALLPLIISFAEETFSRSAALAAGTTVAFYQVGYGIAAFAVGPLRAVSITLPEIFLVVAVVAVAMGGVGWLVTRSSDGREHPRQVRTTAHAR